jgi:hypothetical protein
MDFSSLSDAADQPAVAAPATIERNEHYLQAAPVTDVMFDQLEYLIAHKDESCGPDCLDCGRLHQVRDWLLLPFRSSRS